MMRLEITFRTRSVNCQSQKHFLTGKHRLITKTLAKSTYKTQVKRFSVSSEYDITDIGDLDQQVANTLFNLLHLYNPFKNQVKPVKK